VQTRAGYTLVEIVIVVVLTGILAGLFSGLVLRPMQAQVDVGRRAALVDGASSALGRMARDVRAALPNSLRVTPDGLALELLLTADGARYRSGPGTNPSGVDHTDPADWLDLAGDDSFTVLGRLGTLAFAYGAPLPEGTRLAVHPTGVSTWSDAAASADPGVITPAGTSITIDDAQDEDRFVLSAPFTFRHASPRQRLFVVSGPVTYLCDPATRTLLRVDGYSIEASQPVDPNAAPLARGSGGALAEDVAGCAFAYAPGTASRAGLVTLDLALARGDERVRLLQQVHVEGAP
jgi:MSHA biogenesis protein MshO